MTDHLIHPRESHAIEGLPTGSPMHTDRGIVPIQDLRPGDRLEAIGERTRVAALVTTPTLTLVRIRHQFGEFTCAPDQPLPVFHALEWVVPVAAQAIVPGDRICFDRIGMTGAATTMPPHAAIRAIHNTRGHRIVIPELDAEVAWLIGLIHGNGYVFVPPATAKTPNGHVQVSQSIKQQEVAQRARLGFLRFNAPTTMTLLGPRGRVVPRAQATYFRICANATELAEYFHRNVKQPNTVIRVPDWIRDGTPDIRGAYLAGAFDADGSARNRPLLLVATIYPEFARDLQTLYASLGIATRVHVNRAARGNWKTLYHLTTKGMENRLAFLDLIGPYSTKAADIPRVERSPGGFTFPTAMVLRVHTQSWLVPGATQTLHRVVEHTGRQFELAPLEVLAVETIAQADLVHLPVCEGGASICSNGIVFTASTAFATAIASEPEPGTSSVA